MGYHSGRAMLQMIGRNRFRIVFPAGIGAVTMEVNIHKPGADPHSLRIQHFRICGNLQIFANCPDQTILQQQGCVIHNSARRNRLCMNDCFHMDALHYQ